MNYQGALDFIFETFIAAKPFIKGKLDREVRNPHLLLNIAKRLDLLPPPDKLIKITGSKGKGTVARLCAKALEDHFDKVALLVSPEEIDHLDRMRINGKPIEEADFIRVLETLQTELPHLSPPEYLSPYGLFLLIALYWFNEQKVEAFVIETGRGVLFDEGGQLPAKVGCVTSVFYEHPDYLGPTLEEIRADKLSIGDSSDILIKGNNISNDIDVYPAWYQACQYTARDCLEAFLGKPVDLPSGACASFGQKANLYYEGMIARDSADIGFLKRLIAQHAGNIRFYLSLPDDKDVEGICDLLYGLGAEISHIILTGERGYLSYEKARVQTVIYEGGYDDVLALQSSLVLDDSLVHYFIGTQTFLRLIKQAYFL